MKKYKFSIVMAAYNVSNYIEDAIESIINQTIGFSNIQLIIVNDGSIDNTSEICKNYSKKYKNILYLEQENSGVAIARNEGLKRVLGEYVNFLDSDDKLSANTLESVYSFFKKNKSIVDVVAIPIYFFDGKKGKHILNYKFDKSKVIDVKQTFDCPQLSVSSSFIKSNIALKYKFQKGLKYGEDAKFLSEIMDLKMKYGVVANSKYFYRKRIGENQSALQKTYTTKQWYTDTLNKFHLSIIKDSIDKHGNVPKYFQYLLMYDLQWRFTQKKVDSKILSKEEFIDYKKKLLEIVSYIEDDIILAQKEINFRTKTHILKLKYNDKFNYKFADGRNYVYLNNRKLYSISSTGLIIDIIKIEDDFLILEGFYNIFHNTGGDKIKVLLKNINNDIFEAKLFHRYDKEIIHLNAVINSPIGVYFKIPINSCNGLKTQILINGKASGVAITFGKFTNVNSIIKNRKNQYYIFYNKEEARLSLKKINYFSKIKNQFNFYKKLFSEKEYKVIAFRLLALIIHILNLKKRTWIISDRFDAADDSGEHLFKYLRKKHPFKYKLIFVINKNSKDYKRLKKYGKVMDPSSPFYKMYFLYAENIISSHAEDVITNPFGKRRKKYLDLYNFKFTFLQHGIIKDDLSSWLNKYSKNLDLFITSTPKEYNAILNGNYYYKKDVVKLTGLPCYDGLINEGNKRQILLMPTWRANLAGKMNKNGSREYSDVFKYSSFFKFYDKLINNEKLNELLINTETTILFAPHPNLRIQLKDFEMSNNILLADADESYQSMFNQSTLLITDYSSVAFDFAYLKKPVIYTQFDKNVFFDNHSYSKGYFEYDKDGFGVVIDDVESTIKEITKYINNDFKMEKKYIQRVDSFFQYNDCYNCDRVYREIEKL